MPVAFQKVMDYTLAGLKNTHCFLDDIIIVIRISKEEHLKLIYALKNLMKKTLDLSSLNANLLRRKSKGLATNLVSPSSPHRIKT